MTKNEMPPADESVICAMHITTPDHVYGWVIIIDDKMIVRVAVSGNHVLERVILNEPNTSIGYEAWDMVIRTLGLTGPRDQYKVQEVSTSIPKLLTQRIVAADTAAEEDQVISELALYIGKDLRESSAAQGV